MSERIYTARHTITIAFPDETRYHDYRQKNRAVLVECYQHAARPPERISALSIEVFYNSCLYEHDSRENTKRQEPSDIR
jgi:hypothetical protein